MQDLDWVIRELILALHKRQDWIPLLESLLSHLCGLTKEDAFTIYLDEGLQNTLRLRAQQLGDAFREELLCIVSVAEVECWRPEPPLHFPLLSPSKESPS